MTEETIIMGELTDEKTLVTNWIGKARQYAGNKRDRSLQLEIVVYH